MCMPSKELTLTQAAVISGVCIFLISFLSASVRAETTVGVFAGHWSHHWVSEDITNERHALVAVRIGPVVFGRFDNSYTQKGFSGDTQFLGAVRDGVLWGNVNRWYGDVTLRLSIGVTYGYTEFAGHDSAKDRGIDPYAMAGLIYQQPIQGTKASWEVGALQFGDATVPTVGIQGRF